MIHRLMERERDSKKETGKERGEEHNNEKCGGGVDPKEERETEKCERRAMESTSVD